MNNDELRKKAKYIVSQLTIDEKLSMLTTHHRAVERLNIPEFNVGTEIARGFVGRDPKNYSTVFPQPIGLAGTFDTELMELLGEITGNETRAYYNEDNISPFLYGPTVDMERDSRWGRTEEAYGEDVCLAGEMTRAYTTGLAGDDGRYCKTIPTLKHFCANNNEENRGGCNAYLPLRLKYEYYYAAFMNAIKYGGAKSVMAAYNKINGIPGLCNPDLKQLGTWFAITDGGAFTMNMTEHKYCENNSETFAETIHAGCAMMLEPEEIIINAGKKALKKNLVTESEIDEVVENVIYMRLRLGENAGDCRYNNITKSVLDSEKSAEINLRAAREQVVLLKNNGILPLKEKPKKIAVVGALADENLRDWYTGYFRNAVSIVEGIRKEFPDSEIIYNNLWDVIAIKAPNSKYISVHEDGTVMADADEITDSELFEEQRWGENCYNLFSVRYKKYLSFDGKTLKLAERHVYGWFTPETFNIYYKDRYYIIDDYCTHRRMTCSDNGTISFIENMPVCHEERFVFELSEENLSNIAKSVRECDLMIYCTGNYPTQYAKETCDRKTINLNLQENIYYLKNLCKNVIMVLVSSYPYAVNSDEDEFDFSAIVYTTHTGATLGTAIAETVSGKNNPAGRLAMTWYQSDLDLPDIMDYDIEKTGMTYMYFKGTPLYPFGYGLSYSEFEYINLTVSDNSAEVTLKNVSDTDGDEVIQLYFSVPDSAVSRPIKKLCAFARVHLKAGEKKTVTLHINPDILIIYDVRRQKMITESGKYIFTAGGSSDNLPLSAELEISGEKLGNRNDKFEAQTFDSANNIEIRWSKRLKKHYIFAKDWENNAAYSGIDFSNKKLLKFNASSATGENNIYIHIGTNQYIAQLSVSDSYDDFKEYTVEINSANTDTIAFSMPSDSCLLDILLS